MKTTPTLIVQLDIDDLQTIKGRQHQNNPNCCYLCGRKLGKHVYHIHMLTDNTIVSSIEDFDNSQGCFPIGSECADKLNKAVQFAFKLS